MDKELKNKTIIVSGASSGIGAASALLFAAEGANVVLGARREHELEQLVGQIIQSNSTAVCLAGDVTDEAYAMALVDLAVDKYGNLDGAFNNVGMMGDIGPIPNMETQTWNDVIETNLTSAFLRPKRRYQRCRSTEGVPLYTPDLSLGLATVAWQAWELMRRPRLGCWALCNP